MAKGSLPPESGWRVQQARVTVFMAAGASAPDSKLWWRALVGSDPEEVTDQPKQAVHQEAGPLTDVANLILQVQPARIDWHIAPPDTDAPPTDFSTIGALPSALDSFVELMTKWLPSAPPLKRLALGATFLQSSENKEAGYTKLGQYLPSVKLDTKSSDFMYQINRPRESRSGIAGLRMNRLTKWSVMTLRMIAMTPASARVDVSDIALRTACRVELDINTAAEFSDALPPSKLNDLLTELTDLSHEIAARGDID